MNIIIIEFFCQETFFAGGAITITQGRGSAVDFAYPYFETRLGIISQKPPPLPRYQAIFWPFDLDLWIALLITVVMFTPFFWVLVRLILKDSAMRNPALSVFETLFLRGADLKSL